MGFLHRVGAFLFDREPSAGVLAASIASTPLAPQAPAFMPEPPGIVVQVYRHGGQRFERLVGEQQEEAQARLFKRLKVRQKELGIQWAQDEIDPGALPATFHDWPDAEQIAYWEGRE